MSLSPADETWFRAPAAAPREVIEPAGDIMLRLLGRTGKPLRVCLVRPATVTTIGAVGQDAVPPLGPAYLAGALRVAGHKVSAVDGVGEAVLQFTRIREVPGALLHGLTDDQVVERIPADAEVIAISAMFTVEWPWTRRLIEAVRRRFPGRLIVLGGEHVTALSDFVMQDCPAADVIVQGEGEETFLDLLDAVGSGRDLKTVKSLLYRKDGEVRRTLRRGRIRNVDGIPEPDWSLWPLDQYIENAMTHGANLGRTMPVLASRGCPYECTFCSNALMWGNLWRPRKPAAVVAEIARYVKERRIDNADLHDLTAIVRKEWIMEFCRLLVEADLGITWQLPSGTRSEALDEEVCREIYRSGGRIINYAPESGSEIELKRIKKRVVLDRMVASMRAARRAGLALKVNLVLGLPGETWGDVFRTVRFATRLALAGVEDLASFPYSPYPGSELFEQLVARGRVKIGDEYCRDLLAYTDPAHSVSYCDAFSSRALTRLNMAMMAWFYALSWALHPWRLAALVWGMIRRDSSTKLMMALTHQRRKGGALALAIRTGQDTVVIPPLFRPKEVRRG